MFPSRDRPIELSVRQCFFFLPLCVAVLKTVCLPAAGHYRFEGVETKCERKTSRRSCTSGETRVIREEMGKSMSKTPLQAGEGEDREDGVKSTSSIGSEDVSNEVFDKLANHSLEEHEVVGKGVEEIKLDLIDTTAGLVTTRAGNAVTPEAEASRVVVTEHESEASHAVDRSVLKATAESPKGVPFRRGDGVQFEQETARGSCTDDETRAIRAKTMKSTPKPLFRMKKKKELMDEVESSLVHGEDISSTPAELANHIGESHEVVNKAVEELADSAGTIIDEQIDNDFIDAAAGWIVEKGVENVLEPAAAVSRVVAEHGSEVAHDVARNGLKATGGSPQGVPDVEPSSIDLTDVGSKSVDIADVGPTSLDLPDGDVVEQVTVDLGLGEAASSVLEDVAPAVTSEAATELADYVMDVVPIVGQVNSACKLVRGGVNATLGVGALTVAACIATVGCGVTLNEPTKKVGRRIAWWGLSMATEGFCIAGRGFTSMVGAVPGTQFITIPLSMFLGYVSKCCAKLRIE